MKIFILNPLLFTGKLSKIARKRQPLELAYIASLLRHDHKVRLLDANALNLDLENTIAEIKNFNPDILILTSTPVDRWEVPSHEHIKLLIKNIIQTINSVEIPYIILTGAHGTLMPEYILQKTKTNVSCPQPNTLSSVIPAKAGIQETQLLTKTNFLDPRLRGDDKRQIQKSFNIIFIVRGEPELIVKNLVNEIDSTKNYKNVLGISYLENNQVINNPNAERIKNLDEFVSENKDYFKNMLGVSQNIHVLDVFNHLIKTIEENPIKDFSIQSLDKYSNKPEIYTLLYCANQASVIDNFGNDAIIWEWGHTVGIPRDEVKNTAISIIGKEKAKVLENVLSLLYFSLEPNTFDFFYDFKTIESNVMLKDNLNEVLTNMDLTQMLIESKISNKKVGFDDYQTFSAKQLLTLYNSPTHYAQGFSPNEQPKNNAQIVWLDSSSGVGIFYEGKINAVVSMYCPTKDTLMLVQYQYINPVNQHRKKGVLELEHTGTPLALHYFDIKKFAVALGKYISKELGMQRVAIQSAENNMWVKKNMEDPKAGLTIERAKVVYDKNALSHGFNPDSNLRNNLVITLDKDYS